MANKKYVYIQFYPKDLLADEKLAKCDKTYAWGAYFALLTIMAMEPIRGCLRLRDWDTHPNNERKSLVANFRNANSLITKSAAFARIVSKRTPLKVKEVAEGIEQLVTFGVVVMHDDALIQPRMFREGKGRIEGYNPEPETEEPVALRVTDKGQRPTHKKEKNNESLTPAPALRTNTRDSNESEHEHEYINNNGSSSGSSTNKGTGKTKPATEAESSAAPTARRPVADNPPTLSDIQAYFDERAAQGKAFELISAEEFLDICEVGGWTIRNGQPILDWKAYLRQCEIWRQRHGDVPKGQPRGQAPGSQPTAGASPPRHGEAVPASPPAKGKYKKW